MPRQSRAVGKSKSAVVAQVKRNKKGKQVAPSRKKAGERSQNAFRLTGSDIDSDSNAEVNSEDDEEIDSDEAFESGDEDKFGSFKFSGSEFLKKQKRSSAPKTRQSTSKGAGFNSVEINLDEDSDQEALDQTSKVLKSRNSRGSSTFNQFDQSSDEESQSDFEDDDGADLMDLSEMLGSRERPSPPVSSSSVGSDDGLEEDDALGTSETSDDDSDDGTGDVNTEALESFVKKIQQKRQRDDESSPKLPEKQEKKRSKIVEDNEQVPESEHNLNLSSQQGKLNLNTMLDSLGGGNGRILRKTQTLAAPLAKSIQDRVNRSAAYDTVKEQITKWQPAVRQMREATVLKFPLNEAPQAQANNNSLASTFKPSNELENQILTILKDSGMQSEKSISKFEDLEMAKLSVEEVQKRRADLAIMRDLLFRQEQKAKRQSKIKSKAYRRVHRKEREKARLAMQENEPVDAAEAAHEVESRRARERMELRHKNTGKWAQKMLSRADHGEGSRAAITEQLQRGEELERKIRGQDDNLSDFSSDDEGEESQVVLEPLPDKGVFSMKFMRDADARQAEALSADAELDANDALPPDNEDLVQNNEGRRTFKPAANDRLAPALSKRPSKKDKKVEATHRPESVDKATRKPDRFAPQADAEENPWLSDSPASRKDRDVMITKDTDDALKFAAKLQKKKKVPLHAGRLSAAVLDVNRVLPLRVSSAEDDQELEAGEHSSGNGQIVMKQLDLVSQAFAGDNVVAEFEAAKDSMVAEDALQDIDETLPGWGSWVGTGVKKSRNAKKFIKHVDGLKADQRKDAKLNHVIINEKRMKQAKPYMSQSVPFPFENKEQYERSLNLPIGPEFTTRTNFQKQIMPHVVKKQGKVVAPMEKPFKD